MGYGNAFMVISAFHYVHECYTMQHEVEKHGSNQWALCWTVRRMGVLVCKERTSEQGTSARPILKKGATENAIEKCRQNRCPEYSWTKSVCWEFNTPSSKPGPCPATFTFWSIPCPVVGCK